MTLPRRPGYKPRQRRTGSQASAGEGDAAKEAGEAVAATGEAHKATGQRVDTTSVQAAGEAHRSMVRAAGPLPPSNVASAAAAFIGAASTDRHARNAVPAGATRTAVPTMVMAPSVGPMLSYSGVVGGAGSGIEVSTTDPRSAVSSPPSRGVSTRGVSSHTALSPQHTGGGGRFHGGPADPAVAAHAVGDGAAAIDRRAWRTGPAAPGAAGPRAPALPGSHADPTTSTTADLVGVALPAPPQRHRQPRVGELGGLRFGHASSGGSSRGGKQKVGKRSLNDVRPEMLAALLASKELDGVVEAASASAAAGMMPDTANPPTELRGLFSRQALTEALAAATSAVGGSRPGETPGSVAPYNDATAATRVSPRRRARQDAAAAPAAEQRLPAVTVTEVDTVLASVTSQLRNASHELDRARDLATEFLEQWSVLPLPDDIAELMLWAVRKTESELPAPKRTKTSTPRRAGRGDAARVEPPGALTDNGSDIDAPTLVAAFESLPVQLVASVALDAPGAKRRRRSFARRQRSGTPSGSAGGGAGAGAAANSPAKAVGSGAANQRSARPAVRPVRKSGNANLSADAVFTLKRWMYDHWEKPYPTAEQRKQLAEQLHIDQKSVRVWFQNHRHRLWKPLYNADPPVADLHTALFGVPEGKTGFEETSLPDASTTMRQRLSASCSLSKLFGGSPPAEVARLVPNFRQKAAEPTAPTDGVESPPAQHAGQDTGGSAVGADTRQQAAPRSARRSPRRLMHRAAP